MNTRDRAANLVLLAAAIVTWGLLAWLFTSQSPIGDVRVQLLGAALLAVAAFTTLAPLLWLAAFAVRGRIAYRGEWLRAARRAAFVGLVAALFVVLRGQGILRAPIALFVVAMVVFVELTLSFRR